MRSSDGSPVTHYRSESRFFEKDGSWYYATREGEHGPFASREDAEEDERRYTGLQSHIEHVKQKPRTPPAD